MEDFQDKLRNFKFDQSAVSLSLGAIVVVIIGILVFNYFNRLNRPATPLLPTTPEVSSTNTGSSNLHKVVSGETLGTIAEKYYGTKELWSKVCEANQELLKGNCNLIEVGQELSIPSKDVAGVSTASPIPASSPAATPRPEISQMPATGTASQAATYTIVRGDTLCGILTKFQGSCVNVNKIAACNNINNPNLIHADNPLKLECQ